MEKKKNKQNGGKEGKVRMNEERKMNERKRKMDT